MLQKIYSLTFFCFLVSLLTAQNIQQGFKINGTIKNADSTYVFLYYQGTVNFIKDSCYVINEKFSFKGYVKEPQKVIFTGLSLDRKPNMYNCTEFYLENSVIHLNVEANNFHKLKVIGSKTDLERIKLQTLKTALNKKIMPLTVLSAKASTNRNKFKTNIADSSEFKKLTTVVDSIYNLLKPLYKIGYKLDSMFIIKNPQSFVSADLFLDCIKFSTIQFASLAETFSKFSTQIKEGSIGLKIKRELAKKSFIPIGSLAKKFIAIDSRNDTVKLEEYQNKKYVLLDFSASWCIPCKQLNPVLLKIITEYNDQLQLINISIEENKNSWLKNIENDSPRFKHILDKHNGRGNNILGESIATIYGISGIPTLILIDKDLKVVQKFGTGPSFLAISLLETELKNIIK